jgi:transglutaminase-like putative cysteine protease
MQRTDKRIVAARTSATPINGMGGGTIGAVLMTVLVLQIFRASLHPNPKWMYWELSFFGILSIGLSYFTRKWWQSKCLRNRQEVSRQLRNYGIYMSQAGAALVFVLFLVWQMIARAFGVGDANEVVALLALQYVAFHLALVGFLPGCSKASLALAGATVFFVCCLSQRFDISCIAAVFSIFTMWCLLGMYWSRLDDKAIDGNSKKLPLRRTSIAATTIVILLAVAVSVWLPKTDAARALRGFSPFSGGENGYEDEFARDGIGDGNMLTGGDNATTTGAVDTDQFIEDHKPSIYDVMSEMYDGPVFKKRKLNRAVSLDAKTKHIHDLKQSEMAGKTFRTMRKSGKTSDKKFENKTTDALFFVAGSVPVRFAVAKFQHFDGWDWTATETDQTTPKPPGIHPKQQWGKPFFALARMRTRYLPGDRAHQVKMMRLETASLPTTSFLDKWHIDFVDNADFFKWDQHGQVKYDGDAIPSQTVIDMYSFVPNFHTMRNLNDLRKDDRFSSNTFSKPANQVGKADSPYLQLPLNLPKTKIDALVADWTASIEPGWSQVEAIVEGVKSDFKPANDWEADDEIANSVTQFIENGGGPSYMFATTCAMALRAAGYQTRLTSGFVVREADYDRVSKQSVVNSDAMHLWPEVCLDGRYWIPVEPTPGYPNPYSVSTVWQRIAAQFFAGIRVVQNRPITSLLLLALVIATVAYRLRIVAAGWLIWWHLVRVVWPAGLLRTTRGLLDVRFWAAGSARPASQTINHWYSQVDSQLPKGFFNLWNSKNFLDSRQAVSNDFLVNICREQLQVLTVSNIKNHFTEVNKGKADDRRYAS